MPDLKPWHIFLLIVLICVGGTYKAMTHFAEKAYAQETRYQVAVMSDEMQLKWMLSELNQMEWDCTNPQTDEWVCSETRKTRFNEMCTNIELKRVKLGLESLECLR